MPDSPVRADMRTLNARFATLKILVVDDEHYMRKVVRTLLMSIGVRTIHEAHDGVTGLEAIRTLSPDIVILDWQMPGLDGAAFVRMVRSPDTFPLGYSDHHADRPRRALACARSGGNRRQ